MRARGGVVVVAGLLWSAVACSGGGAGPKALSTDPPAASTTSADAPVTTLSDAPPAAAKPWTVFVYMAADNDLEQAAVNDIAEMQAGVSDNVNLVVLMDRADGYSSDPIDGIGDVTEARLLHITTEGIDDLGLRGDVTMTDPSVLGQMGAQVFRAFPAEHTALVLWDHAAGWNGFAVDESGGGGMDLAEIASGAQQALAGAGLDKFSLVAFDSCLMGQFEVAAAMAPVTDLLLASEEVVPAHGYDYSALADAVSGNAENFGTVMMGAFNRQARAYDTDLKITLSLLDLSKIQALDEALTGLGSAVAADPTTSVDLLQAIDASLAFGYVPDEVNFQLRDLGQIVTRLAASGTSLAGAATAVDEALNDVVVTHVEGAGFAGARGLSVYAPLSIDAYDTSFADVPTAGAWTSVLDAAYNGGADVTSTLDTSFRGTPSAAYDNGTLAIAAQVDPAAVGALTNVTVFYGAYLPAGGGFPELCLMLGQAAGAVVDASSGVVGGAVQLYQLGLSVDGGASGLLGVFAAVPNAESGTVVLSVPMVYIPPGSTADTGQRGYLLLALDGNGVIVQRSLLLRQGNGTLGEIVPDPAGTLQTVVQQLGADGSAVPVFSESYTEPPALPADLAAIEIVAKPIAPGDGTTLGDNLCTGVVTTDAGGTVQFTFSQYSG